MSQHHSSSGAPSAHGGGSAPPPHPGGGGMMPQQRLVAERRWKLGWPSRSHPATLMADLLRALQVQACRPALTHPLLT